MTRSLVVLVAVAVASCGLVDIVDPQGLPCQSDEHCLSGETCCLGTCATECRRLVCHGDTDCPNRAYACRATVCEKVVPFVCTADTECEAPKACVRGQCECPSGQRACGAECIAHDGCCSTSECAGRGDACTSHACHCTGLSACSPGAICTALGCVCPGRQCGDACVAGHECCHVSDCAVGGQCVDGVCLQ